jgi:ariadne-1
MERHLFSSGHYRRCPSLACSNLLIVGDNTQPALMCSCGQRVCSKCLEEYHFPATCRQYKSYETRLRQSSDHLLSISKTGDNSHCYIAEGKNCPNCGEFVEKNGGKFLMKIKSDKQSIS